MAKHGTAQGSSYVTKAHCRRVVALITVAGIALVLFCPPAWAQGPSPRPPAANANTAEQEEEAAPSPQDLQELLKAAMSAKGMFPGAMGGSAELDLAALKARHQNSIVKIEFTAITNVVETKFNPTKSEDYYAGQEPPHGTGFFVGERDILTNAHVVEEARAGSIRIKSPATGNVEFKADIVGIAWSESIDLAVLRLPEDEVERFKKRANLKQIPALKLGDSDKVKVADPLAILGYPKASDELKVIQCKVTGRQYLKTEFDEFICGHQFVEVGPGGVVQPGNSGGPALNASGEVVGIPARAAGWAFEQGWLIPSNVVLHFLEQINQSDQGRKELKMPRLGISLTENFAGTSVWAGAPEEMIIFEVGVVVREVIPNSLADEWGLKPNDIILGFANKRQALSCSVDFKGYRVTTGRMAAWPPSDKPASASPQTNPDEEPAKLHLHEMIMMSKPGDDVTLWYVRPGVSGMQKIERKMVVKPPVKLPHLGVYEKPPFELWGDFVAQDFDDYNTRLFEAPPQEILKGGVLVTYTEPNSLASRRGMNLVWREPWGFVIGGARGEIATRWVIVETINDKPVKNLAELRAALRAAEKVFEQKQKEPGYDPKRKLLMRERYVQIGFRTNRSDGTVLHLTPAFPIDEALQTRPASLKTEKP
ncbi:trypsin-like peptidase domain-containing protein [Candidatus Sumerlaeota bacterium]|nr:trypsin-like peptidase domain-containing protein [Candidatus Sumerlaeota bacterium]